MKQKTELTRLIHDVDCAIDDLTSHLDEIDDYCSRARDAKQELEVALCDLTALADCMKQAAQIAQYETDLHSFVSEHRSGMTYRQECMFDKLLRLVASTPTSLA